MNNLCNKVIIITGGSGLIGSSIIANLIENGAIVFNADIIDKKDSPANYIYCNITDKISVENAIRIVLNKYDKIDGWINNAYPRTKDWGSKFEDIKVESWKTNVDLQMNSIFICCQSVLNVMQKQQFGSIVNVSSIYGLVGPDFTVYHGTKMTMPAAYSAIKGGVVNFTRYLASYYGLYNIRINCVSPGGIFDNQPKKFVKNYERKVPMKRMGIPEDISPTISFLMSNGSSYITGQNIIIDGGWTTI